MELFAAGIGGRRATLGGLEPSGRKIMRAVRPSSKTMFTHPAPARHRVNGEVRPVGFGMTEPSPLHLEHDLVGCKCSANPAAIRRQPFPIPWDRSPEGDTTDTLLGYGASYLSRLPNCGARSRVWYHEGARAHP